MVTLLDSPHPVNYQDTILIIKPIGFFFVSCFFVLFREFNKRMDGDLPFYYWTLNERYSEEELPSFDVCPEIDEDQELRSHPLRLHRLVINQREDSSIFVAGRAHLPARHKKTIRQSFHKPEDILPNPL